MKVLMPDFKNGGKKIKSETFEDEEKRKSTEEFIRIYKLIKDHLDAEEVDITDYEVGHFASMFQNELSQVRKQAFQEGQKNGKAAYKGYAVAKMRRETASEIIKLAPEIPGLICKHLQNKVAVYFEKLLQAIGHKYLLEKKREEK